MGGHGHNLGRDECVNVWVWGGEVGKEKEEAIEECKNNRVKTEGKGRVKRKEKEK